MLQIRLLMSILWEVVICCGSCHDQTSNALHNLSWFLPPTLLFMNPESATYHHSSVEWISFLPPTSNPRTLISLLALCFNPLVMTSPIQKLRTSNNSRAFPNVSQPRNVALIRQQVDSIRPFNVSQLCCCSSHSRSITQRFVLLVPPITSPLQSAPD